LWIQRRVTLFSSTPARGANLSYEQIETPVVSVVLVVCNVDRFLAESIESILGQTFRDFEFVIVDFGSSDESLAIVSKYSSKDSRIKLHQIPHCGLAEARNASFSFAQGRYVAIMDADDVAVPERLARQVEFMEKHPEVSILGGAVEWIDATGRALATRGNPTGDHEIRSALVERCPLWQPSVLLRREAFVRVGGYRPPFAPAEDYDLWLRMSELFQFANLKEVVLRYRIHPYQVSMRKQKQQTLGKLAAQRSASMRRGGRPDPFDEIQEITPAVLAEWGVTDAKVQNEIALETRRWIRNMCTAGEHVVALKAALDVLKSGLQSIERWQTADLLLMVAGLYWRQNRFLSSFLAAARAVATRPIVVGRPLKPLLLRLGLHWRHN
jgi:Glycosyl transferase family 2